MKVAHFAQFGPNRAGQYATVKDLIIAERACGIDAQFIDSALPCKCCGFYEIKVGQRDGEIETQPIQWAYEADLIVRHTSVPKTIEDLGIPMILCMHGRPENTFLLEHFGKMPVLSFIEQVPHDRRYKAYITFWEEFMSIWSMFVPSDRLHYVPAPVNLDEFKPNGPKFNFGMKSGSPDLLITDMWREDETPFNIAMAAAIFKERYCPTAKLHIFGLPGTQEGPVAVLARALDRLGVWGQCFTIHNEMPTIYRAADILLTPHVIATRVIREACASGTPIIAGTGCRYTPYTANPKDIEGYARKINEVWQKIQNGMIHNEANYRDIANQQFNLKSAGQAMLNVFTKVLNQTRSAPTAISSGRKIFVDIGGHLGETVKAFYRNVGDAAQYQIYSFEPHPEAFQQLTQNTHQLKNVHRINKAVGIEDGIVDLYPGRSACGEGSSILLGKKTGAIAYEAPIRVEMVSLATWFAENILPGDHVVVKMNIEGGEYPLMSQLLAKKLLQQISHLYIQLHSHKFDNPNMFKPIEDQLEEQASKYSNCQVHLNRKGIFTFRELNEDNYHLQSE